MSSFSDAYASHTITAIPCNYGTNHVYFDKPSNYLPWNQITVYKRFGGESVKEKPTVDSYAKSGAPVYSVGNPSYIIAPSAVSTAPIKTITFSGGTGTITTNSTVSSVSYTGGGGVTLAGSVGSTGGVATFTQSSATYTAPVAFLSVPAVGGTGTGATFDIRFVNYSGGVWTPVISVVNPGTGYSVTNSLTLTYAGNTVTLTVTSLTGILTQTYLVQSLSSATGTNLQVYVTRSGNASGTNNAYVTGISIRTGGTGFALNDTITIPGTATGGTSPTNDITLTVTGLKSAPVGSSATQTYYNVAATGGSGSGATFNVSRTGLVGSSYAVTSVTIQNAGTGYTATNTLTISGASIGSTGSNLTITVATTDGGGTLLSSSANYSLWNGGTIVPNQKNQVYTDIPVLSATGSGRGAKATLSRDANGTISSFSITTSGSGYAVDDLLVLPGEYIGAYSYDRTQLGVTADYHFYDALFPKYQATTMSVANIANITTALTPSRTVNGVTLNVGDILLVAAQSTSTQNGLYEVTATNASNMTLVKDTTYDNTPVILMSGTTLAPSIRTRNGNFFNTTYTAPSTYAGTSEPDGSNPSDKDVYYTMEVSYYTGPGVTTTKRIASTHTRFVGRTGVHEYMMNSLPAWYATDDLSDFIALLAFHIEVYKANTKAVFDSTTTTKTPKKLIKYLLKQFGADESAVSGTVEARTLLSNLVSLYKNKGSYSGLVQATSYYTGKTVSTSKGVNLLHDLNTSSFEQSLGFWTPRYTAATAAEFTTNPTSVSGVNSSGVNSMSVINGSVGTAPVINAYGYSGSATTAVTGFAELKNAINATTTNAWRIGPRMSTASTARAAGATVFSTITSATVDAGDYVISVDPTTKEPYFEPGTKAKNSIYSTGTLLVDRGCIRPWPGGSQIIYFSKTATDLQGVLSTYLSVIGGTQYTFSAYVTRYASVTACDVQVGVDWIKADGTLSSTSSATLAAASQSAAGTWDRAVVTATAPVDAAYASPYIQIVNMAAGATYYMDACQFEAAGSASTYIDAGTLTLSISGATALELSKAKAVLGNYITYGQGPLGTGGAVLQVNKADVEVIPYDLPVVPTAFQVPTAPGAVTLTVPTGHGFTVGDDILVVYDKPTSGSPNFTTYTGIYTISGVSATSISYGTFTTAVTPAVTISSTTGPRVHKINSYNITYTSTTAHKAVPGHQVTIKGSVADVSIPSTAILGTPTPYTLTVNLSNANINNPLTSSSYSMTGTAFIDYGYSGTTKVV